MTSGKCKVVWHSLSWSRSPNEEADQTPGVAAALMPAADVADDTLAPAMFSREQVQLQHHCHPWVWVKLLEDMAV